MPDKVLSNEEFLEIARDLEIYHSVFSRLWNLGKPRFEKNIPTACVTFDKKGNHLDFQFNPEFWEKTSPYERNFIICHECMHVILSHGMRLKELNKDLGNISADIVVNEMLVSGFGFDRNNLERVGKNGCWLDTVFKNCKNVDSDRSLEYYYYLLKKDLADKIKQALANGEFTIVDSHEGLDSINGGDLKDILDDVLDSLNKQEKESLKDRLDKNQEEGEQSGKQAGSFTGSLIRMMDTKIVVKKKRWETIIKKWTNRFIKNSDKDHEQWIRINRRFIGICTDLFLPSEMEIEERNYENKKIKVIFFQDTSGSCYHLAPRFFKAAKTLPTNRFEVELYCFDTQVYKTSIESGKLYGFGGTSFEILEQEVLRICKNDLNKYPKAIFVITDGYGDSINPAKPKNWYWFLSKDYKCCIPKECNIYNLRDFE